MNSQNSFSRNLILFILGTFVFLRPHPNIISIEFTTYFGDIMLILLLSIWILINAKKIKISGKIKEVWIVVIFGLMLLLLIAIASENILLEVLKIIYYGAFIFICQILANAYEINRITLIKWLFTITCVMFLVSIIQFTESFGFSYVIKIWGDLKLRTYLESQKSARVYSTFFNANWFSCVVGVLCILYSQILLTGRNKVYGITGAIQCVIMLLGSGSRSGCISFLIGFCLLLVINRKLNLLFIYILPVIIIVSISINVLNSSQYAGTLTRYQEVLSYKGTYLNNNISSLEVRKETWDEGLKKARKADYLPVGKQNNGLAHNSYITTLLYFGLPGFVILVFILLLYFKNLISNFSNVFSIIPMITVFLTMCLTGEYLYSTQVFMSVCLCVWAQDKMCYNPKITKQVI